MPRPDWLDKVEEYITDDHLEVISSIAFYEGRRDALTEINNVMEQFADPQDLFDWAQERAATATASWEAADDPEAAQYYDGLRITFGYLRGEMRIMFKLETGEKE